MKFADPPRDPTWAAWAAMSPGTVSRVRTSRPGLTKHLSLYQTWGRGIDLKSVGVPRTEGCTRCEVHKDVRSVCMGDRTQAGPEKQGGTVIVRGSPTVDEDELGRPFSSTSAEYVDRLTVKWATGPIQQVYAVGCHVGKTVAEETVDACRPYLLGDIHRLNPERLILMGRLAVESTLGLYVDPIYVRRGWTFTHGIPAFLISDPVPGLRNRFFKKMFEKDFEWALTSALPSLPQGKTEVLLTRAEVETYLSNLTQDTTVIDVEHDGTLWQDGFELLCVAMCQDPAYSVVIPADVLFEARDMFSAWLADPRYPKVNQNIKHDRHALYRVFGADMAGIEFDTMLGAQLREPEAPAKLGQQAWVVGFGGYKEEAADEDEDESKGGNKFAKMDPDALHAYSGRDGSCTKRLERWMWPRMKRLASTYERLVRPAFDMLAIVERNGMLLSADAVKAYDLWLKNRELVLDTDMRAQPQVPGDFNPASSQQVAALLFDAYGLPFKTRTATGKRSVAAPVLEEIKDQHAIIPILLELSTVRKQRTTYGLAMLQHISPIDGRVHTTFKLVRTSRLSSSKPNMQNITAPEEPGDEGEWARGCWVAPPGYKLVSLDYSQQELRVACMLSGDKVMANLFRSGEDFHKATAALAFGKALADVTKADRRAAKTVNFGLLFGKGAYALAKDLGIEADEAEDIIDKILGRFTSLNDWRRGRIAELEAGGEIWASWDPPGSKLAWHLHRSAYAIGEEGRSKEAERIRKHAKNQALNTPIQYIANCFMLQSLIDLVRWTLEDQPEVKVVMTVHDSIVLETPEHLVDEVVREGKRIMLQWDSGIVPLQVDAEVGDDWGRMKKV